MKFDNLILKYLKEFTAADAGVGSTGEDVYSSGDTYAPGDARLPKVLGSTLSRDLSGKKKTKKKINEKTIYDYYKDI